MVVHYVIIFLFVKNDDIPEKMVPYGKQYM